MNELEKYASKFNNKFKKVLKLIERYDNIAIFRHIRPDYDAIGSQMGLYTWIKDNFKDKNVIYLGEESDALMPGCFPNAMEVNEEFFNKPFLAIAVDTSGKARVSDERFKLAKYIVKIDHHPNEDPYGNLNIVDENLCAAGELVAALCLSFKDKVMSKEAAEYFYKAIVGDSNRFLYDTVSIHTFNVVIKLMETGIQLSKIYKSMYEADIESLEITKYILDNFEVTPHGVAYYILDAETLKRFNLRPERGKDNINLFDHYSNIRIWCSFSEDINKGVWRVSIRSQGPKINHIASHYNGGGHAQASGAKVKTKDEITVLINELDEYLASLENK